MLRTALVAVVVVLAACRAQTGPTTPAAAGVRAYIAALKSNDARDAYGLLSASVRRQVNFEQFARHWQASAKERAWQVKVLEDSLTGNPNVGERARISFSDGKIVPLEREGTAWRLESELVNRAQATRPRDAVRAFSEALSSRDLGALERVLTERRREGLRKQIDGFLGGLRKRIDDEVHEFGDGRAELRWDENGVRYRIVLRKEDDEWRIDDIHIRPAPKLEETRELEGALEDF